MKFRVGSVIAGLIISLDVNRGLSNRVLYKLTNQFGLNIA